jgi:hypothetical protein
MPVGVPFDETIENDQQKERAHFVPRSFEELLRIVLPDIHFSGGRPPR